MKSLKEKLGRIIEQLEEAGYSWPNQLIREAFPEAFKKEKHWAIEEMDELIFYLYDGKMVATCRKLKSIRSAFNDDGTPKP